MSIERLGVVKVLEDPSLEAYADLILHLYHNRSAAAAVDSQVAKLVLGEGRTPQRLYGLTSSIDDSLAFVGEAFPGWIWRLASCSVSDDAFLMPDFNHPEYGEQFQAEWPEACQRDPLGYIGSDIDLRPAGYAAIAFCMSMLAAKAAIDVNTSRLEGLKSASQAAA